MSACVLQVKKKSSPVLFTTKVNGFIPLCSSEMHIFFTDEALEYSACLSPSFSFVVTLSLTPLSRKYFKGQCLTAKAKVLHWFLSPSSLLFISFLFVCFRVYFIYFITISFPLHHFFWFSFYLNLSSLGVCVSLQYFNFFTVRLLEGEIASSWQESGEITLRRGGDCFEWCSMECNAIV